MAEAKVRKGWTDTDMGKLIGKNGMRPESLKNNRSRKILPNMRFCDVMIIADAAGYDVRFQRREVC